MQTYNNIKFIDFLRFYYNDAINLMDFNHLKKWLKEDGFDLDEINFILISLDKEIQINIKNIRQCYENEIIIGNFHIYLDSVDEFKI